MPGIPSTLANSGCLLFKTGDTEGALARFAEAAAAAGGGTPSPDLLYNSALCHYKQRQYGSALQALAQLVELGVRQHPELSVGR